jgi:hypothetical protein
MHTLPQNPEGVILPVSGRGHVPGELVHALVDAS